LDMSERDTKDFIDREAELELLEEAWRKGGFALVVVYGRRRVGKTRLLLEFAKGKRLLYYAAIEAPLEELREDFARAAKAQLGVPASGDPIDLLEWLASTGQRVLVVLDEFQYMVEADPSLPSRLQRSIDTTLSGSGVFLAVCGSAVSFFERELLAYRSPLFGRSSLSLKLAPLGFPQVRRYLGGYPIEEAVLAYGVFGGTPAYLKMLDPSRSVLENLRSLLKPGSRFYEEAPNLLRQELREPRTYMGILAALASGERRPSQLASAAGVDARALPKYLAVLEELDIVARVAKVGGRGSKLDFRDNYFRFWFAFAYRLRHLIEAGFAEEAVRHVEEGLPRYMGPVYEALVRELLPHLYRAGLVPVRPVEVGSWWSGKAEIDVVAREPGRATAFIEVKWRTVGEEEALEMLEELEAKASGSGLLSPENYYVLVVKRAEGRLRLPERRRLLQLSDIEAALSGASGRGSGPA